MLEKNWIYMVEDFCEEAKNYIEGWMNNDKEAEEKLNELKLDFANHYRGGINFAGNRLLAMELVWTLRNQFKGYKIGQEKINRLKTLMEYGQL